MIFQAWIAQAAVPSLFAFFVAWRFVRKSDGTILRLGRWGYLTSLTVVIALVVLMRYVLVFLFGGTHVVSPVGYWNAIISLGLPALAALFVAFMMRKFSAAIPDLQSPRSAPSYLKPHQYAAILIAFLILFVSLFPLFFANRGDALGNYMNAPIYLYPTVGAIVGGLIVFVSFFADREK